MHEAVPAAAVFYSSELARGAPGAENCFLGGGEAQLQVPLGLWLQIYATAWRLVCS